MSNSAPNPQRPIALYWGIPDVGNSSTKSNFGDSLSQFIVEQLSGRPVIHTSSPNKLLAVGSIIWMAKDGDTIWGSGVLNQESWNIPKTNNITIRAVRGPLTRDLLLAHGVFCPPIYGDPTLLLPQLYYSPVVIERDWALIPHIASADKYKRYQDHIIDVRGDWKNIIDTITRCKRIISSSMHGITVAEAYGIPAIWLKSDTDPFRFHDYYAATGRSMTPAATVDEALARPLNTYIPKLDLEPLMKAFPYPRPLKQTSCFRP